MWLCIHPSLSPGLGKTPCILPPNTTSSTRTVSQSPSSSKTYLAGTRAEERSQTGDGDFVECEYPPYSGERCMYHTMGWGGMLAPLMAFVKRTLF